MTANHPAALPVRPSGRRAQVRGFPGQTTNQSVLDTASIPRLTAVVIRTAIYCSLVSDGTATATLATTQSLSTVPIASGLATSWQRPPEVSTALFVTSQWARSLSVLRLHGVPVALLARLALIWNQSAARVCRAVVVLGLPNTYALVGPRFAYIVALALGSAAMHMDGTHEEGDAHDMDWTTS